MDKSENARDGMIYNTITINSKPVIVEEGAIFKATITKEGVQNGYFKEYSELERSAWTANNRPVVLNHPPEGPVTDINTVIGYLSNATLNPEKKSIDADVHIFFEHEGIITGIKNGEYKEVSIGFWARTEQAHESDEFYGYERDILIDHLAILGPGIKGACSVEDGCGIEGNDEEEELKIIKSDEEGSDDVEIKKDCEQTKTELEEKNEMVINMEKEVETLKANLEEKEKEIETLREKVEAYEKAEEERKSEYLANLKKEISDMTVISEDELAEIDTIEKAEAFKMALNKAIEKKNEEKSEDVRMTFEEFRRKNAN